MSYPESSGPSWISAHLHAAEAKKPAGATGVLPLVEKMPNNPQASKYGIVVLDPGHGTRDKNGKITGAGSAGKYNGTTVPEHEITLDYGMWLMAALRKKGVIVYSTRTYGKPWFDVDYAGHDQEANNKLRADFATSKQAALFVRIHFDGSEDSSASGFSVWYNDQSKYDQAGEIKRKSKLAAAAIEQRLKPAVSLADLGLKRFERPIYGFTYAKQASVLLELAFLSNPADTKYVMQEANLKAITEAAAQGIVDYLARK